MRIFLNFEQAFNEIRRELAEMGIDVHTKTMQDKNIEDDPNYATKELQFYSYRVLNPRLEDIDTPTPEWAKAEWEERKAGIEGNPVNPGEAYKLRDSVWNEFLHEGKFAYSYSDQFAQDNQVQNVIEALKKDPMTRQANIAMWDTEDSKWLGSAKKRVPCSLNWLFQYRFGKLNMEYNMRSCDFATHFKNDVYEAFSLQKYVAEKTGLPVGDFIHHIASFHVYQKDVKDVF